jgi:hypothetical protein
MKRKKLLAVAITITTNLLLSGACLASSNDFFESLNFAASILKTTENNLLFSVRGGGRGGSSKSSSSSSSHSYSYGGSESSSSQTSTNSETQTSPLQQTAQTSTTQRNKCPDALPPEKDAVRITWRGHKYEGQVKNGKPDGIGNLVMSEQARYYGHWRDGLEHGHGIECTDAGDIYDGEWAFGMQEGEGTFIWGGDREGGGSFSGKFVANIPIGGNQVTEFGNIERKYENGFYKYHGGILTITVIDSLFSSHSIRVSHGKGISVQPDGSSYKGEFRNGMNHGIGIQYDTHGKPTYSGEYKNGKRHGFGVYSHSNGQKYEGEWLNGEQSGFGVFTFPSNQKYEGFWRDGKKNGFGIYYYENGSQEQGEWLNDKLIGSR